MRARIRLGLSAHLVQHAISRGHLQRDDTPLALGRTWHLRHANKTTHSNSATQRTRRGGGGTSSAHLEQVRARLVVGLLHHQAGRAEENFDLGLRRVSAMRQKKTEIVR